MKIIVYTIAKNEAHQVAGWAQCVQEADGALVLDTGSSDGTVEALKYADIQVHEARFAPFRYDDAFNAALNLCPDCDVLVRLDMDERLAPGWREQVERAWVDGTTRLQYEYVWRIDEAGNPMVTFVHNRGFHARYGYRYQGATHEGLVRWTGADVQSPSDLRVVHHRKDFQLKDNDLFLLEVAARENPSDARISFYLGREYWYHGQRDKAGDTFRRFIDMPGRWDVEAQQAYIYLSYLDNTNPLPYLLKALAIGSDSPEVNMALGECYYHMGKAQDARYYYGRALGLPVSTHYLADARHANGHLVQRVMELEPVAA